MIKLLDILQEIGDSKAGAFTNTSLKNVEYTNSNEPYKVTYSFSSDENDYVVNILYMGDPKTQMPNKRYYLYIDFKTEKGNFSDVTKENIPFRIMATVTNIVKDEVNRIKNDKKIAVKDKANIVAGVLFAPAESWAVGKFGVAKSKGTSSRKNLYIAYIKKNMPGTKEVQVPSGLEFPAGVTPEKVMAFEFPKVTLMSKLKNLFKEEDLNEWKIAYKNKYIDWLYDEEINEYYPVINKQRIKDYLESIIDPTMIDSVNQWINDTDSADGLLETEIDFFGNRDITTKEEAFSIPESDIEEMATQAMSFWLGSNGNEFPFREDI